MEVIPFGLMRDLTGAGPEAIAAQRWNANRAREMAP
jgi:hypothetical protein